MLISDGDDDDTAQNTWSIIVKEITEMFKYSSVIQICLGRLKLCSVDLKWLYYCALLEVSALCLVWRECVSTVK